MVQMSRGSQVTQIAEMAADAIDPGDGEGRESGEDGIALVLVLLVVSVVGVLATGLSMAAASAPRASANLAEARAGVQAARAGLAVAMHALSIADSWDAWLGGGATSSRVDGPPSGIRRPPGIDAVDVGGLTNMLNCGSAEACSGAAMQVSTAARPWGLNNPRWRPILYGTADALGLADATPLHYIVVWIADDPAETDGLPDRDALSGPGAGVVMLRATAFGRFHSRQTISVVVSRHCQDAAEGRICAPGLGARAWRAGG